MDLRPDVITVAATRADGGLTVSRFIVREYRAPTEDEMAKGITDRVAFREIDPTPEFINEVYARKRTGGDIIVSWEIVPNDYCDTGTDRTFRNAWAHEHGKSQRSPRHDMPKAREIHRVYLRKARMAEFCRLDNDYRIADEANDQKAKKDIGAVKQKFRDVTDDPRIEACQTVEELKALRLDVLVPETLGVKYMEKLRVSPDIPRDT